MFYIPNHTHFMFPGGCTVILPKFTLKSLTVKFKANLFQHVRRRTAYLFGPSYILHYTLILCPVRKQRP